MRFYRDEGESGAKEDRQQLSRLLRDCRAGRVRCVIVPSIDRLSRDVRIAENLFHEFATLGVDVLIADMPTYNARDRKDVLICQIREAIAEEARKDIIEHLLKGRQERVRRGLPPGGNPPYGYRRVSRGLVADREEARVVRSIFQLSETGKAPGEIASTLSARRLKRRNGQPWTRRRVAAILTRRDLYGAGRLRYSKAEGKQDSLVLLSGAGSNERRTTVTS